MNPMSGRTLVFLHGFCEKSSHLKLHFPPPFSQLSEAIPGFGYSPLPAELVTLKDTATGLSSRWESRTLFP